MHKIGVCSVLFVGVMTGCAVDPAADEAREEGAGEATSALRATESASQYPEAVLLDDSNSAEGGSCAGALIAPRVVLTSGDCAYSSRNLRVRAGSGDEAGVVDSSRYPGRDVGLLFLDRALWLDSYAGVASSPVYASDRVVGVGRSEDGGGYGAIAASDPVAVERGDDRGYDYDYVAQGLLDGRDEGTPFFLEGSHVVVAVGSRSTDGLDLLARVDGLGDWMRSEVERRSDHGGDWPTWPGGQGGGWGHPGWPGGHGGGGHGSGGWGDGHGDGHGHGDGDGHGHGGDGDGHGHGDGDGHGHGDGSNGHPC